MRLFVALSTSPEVRESLAGLIEDLRRADAGPRWVNPASLHITLKFIGAIPDERLTRIDQSLAATAKLPAFRLEFRGIGFFPNERRPSVVWVGISSGPELNALTAAIDSALGDGGIARETRPFTPHLTLARFKENRLSESLRNRAEAKKTQLFGELRVGAFHLMQSHLKSTGAEYTTLRSYSLDSLGSAS
jgi:2'-5' RNA ligase